jgi:hypothetical protein
MKYLRLSTAPGAWVLLACLSLLAFCPQQAAAESEFAGASYVITTTDSTGGFASRGVITLHPDHTMSVIDSGQGGPFFFTSQLGVWGVGSKGTLVGRTPDFDFPPNADVARLDYTFKVGTDGSISGTITLRTFPLTGNPLDGGGTLVGTFTFTGHIVTRP